MRSKYLIHTLIGLVAIAALVMVNEAPAAARSAPAAAAVTYPDTYGPHLRVYVGRLQPMCLNNPHSSLANGTVMIIYTCQNPDTANQDWYFAPVSGNPYYNIWNGASGKCLTVLNASMFNNAPVIQYTCNTGANEEWYTVPEGYSCDYQCYPVYHIVNKKSERCLTVKNAATTNNSTLLQFDCNDGDNQLWAM